MRASISASKGSGAGAMEALYPATDAGSDSARSIRVLAQSLPSHGRWGGRPARYGRAGPMRPGRGITSADAPTPPSAAHHATRATGWHGDRRLPRAAGGIRPWRLVACVLADRERLGDHVDGARGPHQPLGSSHRGSATAASDQRSRARERSDARRSPSLGRARTRRPRAERRLRPAAAARAVTSIVATGHARVARDLSPGHPRSEHVLVGHVLEQYADDGRLVHANRRLGDRGGRCAPGSAIEAALIRISQPAVR